MPKPSVQEILAKRSKVPVLREVNWAGPCIDKGIVMRENEMWWFIDPLGFESRTRIKKGPCLHTEPCNRCMDHPQTDYPRGYEG